MECKCNAPANVAHNVCGVCLRPLHVGQMSEAQKGIPKGVTINLGSAGLTYTTSEGDQIISIKKSDYDSLSERLREADGVIARLAECHFPSKACKGEDLPQVMLEENISIAKAYLSKTPKEGGNT